MNIRKFLLAASVFTLLSGAAFIHTVHAQNSDERTAGSKPGDAVSDSSETYRELNLFGDVFERVRAQYVDPVTDKKLIEYALNGMLSSLDPHSGYLNEEDFKEMQVQTRGEFGGLGIEVTMENGLVKVVSPIDDTPAFKAGVKAGDYITHLDGKPIVGMTLSDAVEKMRGKVGEPIKLTIRREGVSDPIQMTISRDIIKIKSVRSEVMDGNVGYIRITTFNQNTDTGLKKAFEDIKAKTGKNLAGYILDLRNNPGGLLDEAIAVSDAFLDKGEIVSTRGRHAEDTKRDNATPGDDANGLPVVVMINSGSASASEIVSGALQDHKRAIVLGTQSFGKGSVQTVIPVPGHGALRLTTARYFTPSGRSIQAKGITPDIIVPPAKIEQFDVERLKESDLRGALANPDSVVVIKKKDGADSAAGDQKEGPDTSKSDDMTKTTGSANVSGDSSKEGGNSKTTDDYQLARAIDLIHGVSLYEAHQQQSSMPVVDESKDASDKEAAPARK
jgi:carboxyl-terminal processing protease